MQMMSWGLHVVLRMFPEAHAQANARRYFPLIEQALGALGLVDARIKVFAYATVRAESAGFGCIPEHLSRLNTARQFAPGNFPAGGLRDIAALNNAIVQQHHFDDRFGLYNSRMHNNARGDAELFRGRGFVQLTGRSNYTDMARKLHLPALLDNPDLAQQPDVAARILARFVKDKEGLIRGDLAAGHLKTARSRVNGGTHGMPHFETAYRTGMALIQPVDPPDLSRTA